MRCLSLITLLLSFQFLAAQSVPEPLPPQGHSLYIMDFDIHPDSKSYVTVGIDRKMIAWDIKTGVPYESIKAHQAEIYSVRYDWMGDTIITASPDSTVKLWRAEDMSLIHTIHTGVQNSYAESGRHNNKIVVAGNDGAFIVYDKINYKELYKVKAHEGRVNCAAFSTNGALVFSGGENGWVYGYDYTSGKKLFELDLKSPVKHIAFDMFNTAMVIHTMNGRAEILLVPSFQGYGAVPVQNKEYFGNIKFVSQIDISPDNNWFAYADSAQSVFIADAKTREARGYQTPHTDFISKVKFSFDMKYLLSLDHDQKMVIAALHNFDFEKSKQMPVRIAKQYSDNPRRIYFSNFNELCIRGFYAYKWNLVNGNMETLPITLNYENHLKNLLPHTKFENIDLWIDAEQDVVLIQETTDEHFKDPKNYAFNEDRSKLWMQIDQQFYVINTSSLELEQTGKFKENRKPDQILFENAQIFIAIDDELTCYSVEEGKMKKSWQQNIKGLVHCDVDKGVVAVGTTDFYLHFLESSSGETRTKWSGDLGTYQRVQFHPTENWLATTSFDGVLTIWDLAEQSEVFVGKINNTDVHDIAFSKKGRMIAVIGNDNVIRVFDLKEKNAPPSFEIYTMKEKGMVAINQDAYYQSTKNAHQNLAYKYEGEIYSCQQFDALYNRPDLVLKGSPFADEWYVDMLSKAYEKRVDKLNVKSSLDGNESFPEASIANKDAFPNIIEENEVTLNLIASDSTEGLASVNLYINNVPYYGKNGKSISGVNYNQELKLELPSGNNNIRWVVKNKNGAESLFDEIDLNVITEQKPNLYIASIGVAEYKDERFNLDYPAKDAEDVINNFEKSNTYNEIHTQLLVNEKVTKEKILELRAFFEQAGPNDVVMLFVAGHGLLDEELSYYFATYDIDFNAPEKQGLAYAALEDLLDGLNALKKVLLMDTCHSGEVDEDEVELTAQTETVEGDIKFRTAGAGVREKEGVGAVKASELAKELFADMRDGSGVTVISSAGGAEYAMESGEWKNGLFTYCLLQGLKSKNADLDTDGKITISEMQWYIKDRVTKLSEGKQVPTYRTENIEMDFELF